jgi:hypothetical protein
MQPPPIMPAAAMEAAVVVRRSRRDRFDRFGCIPIVLHFKSTIVSKSRRAL